MKSSICIPKILKRALPLLLLTGCASIPAPPTLTQLKVERVEVPVKVACVNASDIPAIPPTAMRKGGDVGQLAAGAASDVLNLQAYAEQTHAMLLACSKPTP